MARMYVREGSYTNPEVTYECQEFYLQDALDYQDADHAGLKIIVHSGDLTNPFVGIRMSGTAASFPVTEGGSSYRVDLFDFDEMVNPFLSDLKLGVNIEKSPNNEYGNVTWITPNPVTSGVKPSDWDTNWRNYYWVDGGNRWMPNTSSEWVPTRQYYHPGNHLKMLYVSDGLKRFNFGITTRLSYYYAADASWRNRPYSGMASTLSRNDLDTIGNDADDLQFKDSQGNMLVRNTRVSINQWKSTGANSAIIPAGTQSIFAQSYPVHFVVPAGTHIGSKGINEQMSTDSSYSFTPTKNTAFFGVLTVSYDYDGFPASWVITAMEANMWKSATRRQNDYGADTTPTGGNGPQRIGKFNPRGTITKAKNGGILTDPTSGKGFVIYKMSPATFSNFMEALYSRTVTPEWTQALLSSYVYSLAQLLGDLKGGAGLTAAISGIPFALTDMSNIVFIKNSPVDFHANNFRMFRVSVGSLGAAFEGLEVGVVDEYVKETAIDFAYNNNANSFTDVEPYKTASLYCPLVGEMQIMPSYLENAEITGTVGYNILNDGAACALQIQGDNGVIRVSKSGQCAKSADFVLTKNNTGDALSKLVPAAAVGAATIATGGTTAPALATTAAGAATGFVQDSTTMSVVNVPQSATGNAYDECVYGGLRSMYLTSVKSERFVSGENVSGTNMRAKVIGQYSYQYIGSISEIAVNEFASFTDVDLKMGSGMTKAEYDKIMSYLHEGVYI